MKPLLIVSAWACVACAAGTAWAVDVTETLKVEVSEDQTAQDIPVKFEVQRAIWTGEQLQLWGKLHNDTDKDYQYVQVIFTVYDKDGKFVSRSQAGSYPDRLGKKKVSYVDAEYVNTRGDVPAKVTVKVTGNVDEDEDR